MMIELSKANELKEKAVKNGAFLCVDMGSNVKESLQLIIENYHLYNFQRSKEHQRAQKRENDDDCIRTWYS